MATKKGDTRIEDIYPLSPMQQGMLFHCLLDPTSPVYSERYTYTIGGPLNIEYFAKAWEHLAKSHPMFRSIFRWEGLDKPVQVVINDRLPEMTLHDLRMVSEEQQKEKISQAIQARKPFDMAKGPLMRLNVFLLRTDRFFFIWDYHHILMDGWCLSLVMNDLFLSYLSLEEGKPLPVIQRPLFKNYMAWLSRQEKEAPQAYWKERLQGFSAPTSLPHDFKPAAKTLRAFHQVTRVFSKEQTLVLQEKAKEMRITLSSLVQAAWGVLLGRYSGSEDVLFGVTVSGRPADLAGADQMIGLFINSLPVRTNLTATVMELLKDVQSQSYKIQEFSHSFLPDVRAASSLPGNVSLFDSLVIFENYPTGFTGTDIAGGIQVMDFEAIEMTHFDLTLVIRPVAEMELCLEYAGDLFRQDTIIRLLEHLGNILVNMCADPACKVADLELMTPSEKIAIIEGFNATALAYPRDVTLVELFEQRVRESSAQAAAIYEDKTLTYDGLNRMANKLARALSARGVKPGMLVGMMVGLPVETIVTIWGILKAGGAYMPIDPDFPASRIEYMLGDSAAPIVITREAYVSKLPLDQAILCIDRDIQEINAYPDDNPESNSTADAVAYAIYTSGSTGKPKGTLIPHRGVVNLVHALEKILYSQHPGTLNVAQLASFSFDASVQQIFGCLLLGHTLYPIPGSMKKDMGQLIPYILKNAIDVIDGTPSLWELLVANGIQNEPELKLKQVIIGGEALPVDLVRRYHAGICSKNTRWINVYGVTESSVDSTFCPVDLDALAGRNTVPIGAPIANTRIYILDKHKKPVPIGMAGEIYIAGDGLAHGYLNQPERTEATFIPDPFHAGERMYKSGDLGKWLPEGYVDFLGRIDFQVKIRGFRIELGEIEAALNSFSGVSDSVVMDRLGKTGEKYLIGYYVAPENIPVADFRAYLTGILPDYMVPSLFMRLPALPLNTSGKVDRESLPEPEGRQESVAEYVAPGNDIERTLAAAWQEVLGVDRVGMHDNFFDLGGHSLLVMKVLAKLKMTYPLSVQDFFDYPVIHDLAQKIGERLTPAATEALPETRMEEDFSPIEVNIPISGRKEELSSVLLTGVTGYLGAHLLKELLARTTATVYCLIRGKSEDEANKRLQATLDFYFSNTAFDMSRIIPVPGDLTRDDLGLTSGSALPGRIDAVLHSAADVRHFGEYAHFKEVNVLGTRRLIDLARAKGAGRFHHISTLGVSGDYIRNYARAVFKEQDYDRGQVLDNVYGRSKFEAEGLVLSAMQDGLPATIYRVGNVVGSSATGQFQKNIADNAFYGLIKAITDMGMIPKGMDATFDMTPVDCLSQAIVELMRLPETNRHCLHMFNPNRMTFDSLASGLGAIGYNIRIVDMQAYLGALEQEISGDAIEKLMPQLSGGLTPRTVMAYDTSYARYFLDVIGFTWPVIDEALLRKLFRYAAAAGYLKVADCGKEA